MFQNNIRKNSINSRLPNLASKKDSSNSGFALGSAQKSSLGNATSISKAISNPLKQRPVLAQTYSNSSDNDKGFSWWHIAGAAVAGWMVKGWLSPKADDEKPPQEIISSRNISSIKPNFDHIKKFMSGILERTVGEGQSIDADLKILEKRLGTEVVAGKIRNIIESDPVGASGNREGLETIVAMSRMQQSLSDQIKIAEEALRFCKKEMPNSPEYVALLEQILRDKNRQLTSISQDITSIVSKTL